MQQKIIIKLPNRLKNIQVTPGQEDEVHSQEGEVHDQQPKTHGQTGEIHDQQSETHSQTENPARMPKEAIRHVEPVKPRDSSLGVRIRKMYEQGYQDGLTAGEAELKKIGEAWEKEADHLSAEWQNVIQNLESEIVALILRMMEHLLCVEIKERRYDIEKIVGKVMEELRTMQGMEILEIHCNPEDIAILEQNGTKYSNIRLISDSQIQKSDCKLKTNLGQAIVSLQERRKQIEELFKETGEC